MELLKVTKVTYQDTVYQHLCHYCCSETHHYTCSCALPVSVTGGLFTTSQQSWWAQFMWLDYKLIVLSLQFPTTDPRRHLGAPSDAHSVLMHPFIKMVNWEAVLEKCVTPPVKPLTMEVSTTRSVFIFCHSGLLLKLLIKGTVTILQ
jgi:hypothetical protein